MIAARRGRPDLIERPPRPLAGPGRLLRDLGSPRWLAAPVWQAPAWSVQALVELVVPLAITVLVVQNGQGVAMLRAARHAGEKPDRHAPLVGELRGPAQRSIVRRSGWRRGNWRFA